MVTITYFPHCNTTDNEQGLSTGWLPGKLSEKGHQEAEQMVKDIAGRQFDLIIASDLQRAVDSAHLIFKDKEIVTDERLREVNYGDNNGKPKAFKSDMTLFIDQPFPNGESYSEVENRVRAFCNDMKQRYDGKHIAVVSHEAPQLAMEVIINGKTWPQAIAENWRHTHAYRPSGWQYLLN